MAGVIWLGDASALARVLRGCAPARRAWVLHRMVQEAARAAAHLRATGRAHPRWGDGSFLSVALRRRPMAEPPLSDTEFCFCLSSVLWHLSCANEQRLSHWHDRPMWYGVSAAKGKRDAKTSETPVRD
ncbi:hypothetical protein [Oceaniglobus ichthyenteri]|uniref:DUF7742 family protein n=1 Tax=Oceaniglobus ichthyenteri TaxID=2136177 RepID=UPI000D3CA917|nr:hypothetical protein [Oceaniglobus ichthyenteri]